MTIAVAAFPAPLNDISFNLRKLNDLEHSQSPVKVAENSGQSHYSIFADKNGEYNLTGDSFSCDTESNLVFYDGAEKILEINYNAAEKKLVLTVLTAKQVNIFKDIDVSECVIESPGSLCIDAKLNITEKLDIAARSLCFLEDVNCQSSIKLNVEQGLSFLSDIRCQSLDIHAAYVHQAAKLQVDGFYDLSAQAYHQKSTACTSSKLMRLIAEQCEVQGEFVVAETCFLTANYLLIGAKGQDTLFNLPGVNHLHAINCNVQGSSQLSIGSQSCSASDYEKNKFIVDDYFFIADESVVDYNSTNITSAIIENNGSINISCAHLSAATFIQHHLFSASSSEVLISRRFNHQENAQSGFIQTEFKVEDITISGGELLLDDAELRGNTVEVFDGVFNVKNNSDIYFERLSCFDGAKFNLHSSQASISQSALCFGVVSILDSTFSANMLSIEEKSDITHSKVRIETECTIKGVLTGLDSVVYADKLRLSANVAASELRLYSSSIDVASDKLELTQTQLETDTLHITGGVGNKGTVFLECQLVAKKLSFMRNVHLTDSLIIGINDEGRMHEIKGALTLERTRFFTQSLVHTLKGKSLHLVDGSTIRANQLHTVAELSLDNSKVHSKNFIASDASVKAQHSEMHVLDNVIASNSDITLTELSTVSVNKLSLAGASSLTLTGKSILAARKKVAVSRGATLESEQSSVVAEEFIVVGRVSLNESLLCAKELLIYNDFAQKKQSVVNVSGKVFVAASAHLESSQSAVKGGKVHVAGNLSLDDSALMAEKSVVLATGSKASIKNNTSITAESLSLSGDISSTKKSKEIPESSLTLKATANITVSESASVDVSGKLMVDAKRFTQAAMIKASHISVNGEQLHNTGSLSAESIFMALDENALNHGVISAKNIKIQGGLLNILGSIYARQSLSCTGFYSVNLGLISANNYVNDSLGFINAGIIVPNLNADVGDVLSANNLISAATTLARTVFPTYANGISLVSMLPGLYSVGANVYTQTKALNFSQLSSMRQHEYMPLLCSLKNTLMFGQGFYATSNGAASEYQSWSSSAQSLYADPKNWGRGLLSGVKDVQWSDIGYQAVSSLAGSYNNTSLIQANMGVSFSANSSKTSVCYLNTGYDYSLFSHSVNTQYLYNSGVSSGANASFSAATIDNGGTLEGSSSLRIKANKLVNGETGVIESTKQSLLDINKLEQNGALKVENGRATINSFTDTADSATEFKKMAISGDSLDTAGHMSIEQSIITETLDFTSSDSSKLHTDNVSIQAKNKVEIKGQLDYEHALNLKGDKVVLAEGSVVNGARTAEEKLFVPAATPENAANPNSTTEEPESSANQEGGKVQSTESAAGSDDIKKQSEAPAENTGDSKEKNTELTESSDDTKERDTKPVADSEDAIEESPEAAETKDETAEQSEKPKKEFKPQHVLSISAKHTVLAGKMSGGDYTQLGGIAENDNSQAADDATAEKVEKNGHLEVADSADIDLTHGSISQKEAVLSGSTALKGFSIDIDSTQLAESGDVSLKDSFFQGQELESEGVLVLENSCMDVDSMHLSKNATETLVNSTIKSKSFVDESEMGYRGQSGIVTDSYKHTGHVKVLASSDDDNNTLLTGSEDKAAVKEEDKGRVKEEDKGTVKEEDKGTAKEEDAEPANEEAKNLFFVKAKTATLEGSADLDNGFIAVEHIDDAASLVAGTGAYAAYKAQDSLGIETDDAAVMDRVIERDCDLSLKAADIKLKTSYQSSHDLSLESSKGDVVVSSDVKAKNVFIKSEKNIVTNHRVEAEKVVSFTAKEGAYNYGGTITGDIVAIKAAEVKNITRDSAENKVNDHELPTGAAGVVSARSTLQIEATKGDVANYGGIMRGGVYTQIVAEGNVLNVCNEHETQGQFDKQKTFDGGLIAGGAGSEDNDNVGLYIKAKGKVISDASDFVSNGTNYIEGVQGVKFKERHHTYISKDETHKTWYGKKSHVVETTTTVKGTKLYSSNGRNIIQSGEGEVHTVAAQFISPGGTDIYAKGEVKLFSLKTNNKRFESRSSFWGLSKSELTHVYDSSAPTLFLDNGATRIVSEDASVDARGAYFAGDGDLYIKAKKRIALGVDILDHEVTEKTQSLGFSTPGMGGWGTHQSGGSAWDCATAEDATLAKLNALSHGNNTAETLANASNLGIDLYNTSSSVMRGIAGGSLSDELMSRYGLGGANGFSPTFTATLSETQSHSKFQTQAQGGINRGGNVKLEAGEGVDLYNGVSVKAGKDLEVDAPELLAHAAELKSSSKTTTESLSVSFTVSGVESAGVSYSKSTSSSTNFENAHLSAGGNVKLHNKDGAMDVVELDGATISGKTLDLKTKKLIIKDKQDVSQSETESISASTSGQFSAYSGKGHSKTVNQHSGLHISEGVNTDGHSVEVGETYMEGGQILTEGENKFTTDKLTTVTLEDTDEYSGIGISGNVHDLERLNGATPQNATGEKAIASLSFSADKVDYSAKEQAVIYGDSGTSLDINEQIGQVHTSSSDGKIVEKDAAYHVTIDIPVTNKAYLEQSALNIQAGAERLAALAGVNQPAKVAPKLDLQPTFTLEERGDASDAIEPAVDSVEETELEDDVSIFGPIDDQPEREEFVTDNPIDSVLSEPDSEEVSGYGPGLFGKVPNVDSEENSPSWLASSADDGEEAHTESEDDVSPFIKRPDNDVGQRQGDEEQLSPVIERPAEEQAAPSTEPEEELSPFIARASDVQDEPSAEPEEQLSPFVARSADEQSGANAAPEEQLSPFIARPVDEQGAPNAAPEEQLSPFIARRADVIDEQDAPSDEPPLSGYEKAKNRALGVVYIVGGVLEASAAAGMEVGSSGTLTALAFGLGAYAMDSIVTGVKQVYTGEPESTSIHKAAASITGSEAFADGLDLGVGLGLIGVGGRAATTAAKQELRFFSKSEAPIVEGTGLPAHSMSDKEVRVWYKEQIALRTAEVDRSLPAKERGLQEFKLRNEIKMQARELMSNREAAAMLEREHPLKTLKDLARKSYNKDEVGDDMWNAMRESAKRTNREVDEKFNLNHEQQARLK